MIRIKLYYDRSEYFTAHGLCRYEKEDFYRLVQGYPGEKKTGPPMRDADSLRFIREIDHAEFVEGDWYSVITPFNRTNMTALCGGTKYALTVIANSRRGIYTSYKGYGDDIWSRLADLSIDVLIALPIYNIGEYPHYLPFRPAVRERVVIENYKYNGKETEAYLGDSYRPSVVDRKLYVSGWFKELAFNWRENLDIFIKEAESLLKQEEAWYRYPPTIMSIEEFVETLGAGFAVCISDYLGEPDEWEADIEGFRREQAYLKSLTIHNYMRYVPTEINVKYPIVFVIKKHRDSGACTVSRECGYKYPTFPELFMEGFVRLSDEERPEFEKLVIVFDVESFYKDVENFKNTKWALKLYDNIVELYDGIQIMKEFVDFLKPSYDAGLVTILERE